MGGLADYSGALTLHLPLGGVHLCRGASARGWSIGDRAVRSIRHERATVDGLWRSRMWWRRTEPMMSRRWSVGLPSDDGVVERCAIGVVSELLRAELVLPERIGLTIAVGCTVELGPCAAGPCRSRHTCRSESRARSGDRTGRGGEALPSVVENRWFDVPVGVSVAAGALIRRKQLHRRTSL